MKPQANCCKDCKDRWVNGTTRCHSHCDKYKAYQAELAAYVDMLEKANRYESELIDYESDRSLYYRKKRARCGCHENRIKRR